jgi:hypothetical protein
MPDPYTLQHADYCTLAGRGYFSYPDLRFSYIGFRLARSSGNQPSGVGDALGGTTSVSSDSRGTQPRPHPADKAALARGKNGRRRSIALQGVRRAPPRRLRVRRPFVPKHKGQELIFDILVFQSIKKI